MQSLLEEKLISSYKNEMISFLRANPEYFNEAIELAVSDRQPFAWRAAWLLWSCMEKNDNRVKKHINTILKCISKKADGHKRELLKILSIMNLNETQEGKLFNICMDMWEQIDNAPSVRFSALKFIVGVIKKHPELSEEIVFLTQDHYLKSLSPGIKNSVGRLIVSAD
jgi:hypothetical protein